MDALRLLSCSNSGGPLVNLDGDVVGINTAIVSQSGGNQGVGLAIPVNLAKTVMDGLIKHGKVTRGWLGVSIQSITPEMAEVIGLDDRRGALIGDVFPGGPAEKAGIQRGDVVLSVAGKDVRDSNDLMNRVAVLNPGDTVGITVLRAKRRLTLEVKISKRKDGADASTTARSNGAPGAFEPGLKVADLSDEMRQRYEIGADVWHGAVVTGIDPNGMAQNAGLQEGDVIVEANHQKVRSASEFRSVVHEAEEQRRVLLLVNRKGRTSFAVTSPRDEMAP